VIAIPGDRDQGFVALVISDSGVIEQIGDPTLAGGILDRLVHSAHRIEMRGESMRKPQWEKGDK
jgi:hypothetical protein